MVFSVKLYLKTLLRIFFSDLKFRNQEFSRIGYYVNNEYEEVELKEYPPQEPQFNKMIRTILHDQPRVTKFKINWEPEPKKEENLNTTEVLNINTNNQSEDKKTNEPQMMFSTDDLSQNIEKCNLISKLTSNQTSETILVGNKENLVDPKNENGFVEKQEIFKQHVFNNKDDEIVEINVE